MLLKDFINLLRNDIQILETSENATIKSRLKDQRRIYDEMLGIHKFKPIEKEMNWIGHNCRICGNILTKYNCYPSQNDYVCKACKRERKHKHYVKNRREERTEVVNKN